MHPEKFFSLRIRVFTTHLTFALFVLAAVAGLAFAGDARADGSGRFARLAALQHDIQNAEGPAAYPALRRLWTEWDRGDPSSVEEILRLVASDTARPVAVRSYAEILRAYARRRRGDLDTAKTKLAELGFVNRWLLLGPFDNEGKAGHLAEFEPEEEQAKPVVLTKSYEGKAHRMLRWRNLPPVSPFGWVDLSVFLRPTENACGYLLTFVRDSRTKEKIGARPIGIWAGSAGAMHVWWNGTEVLRDDKYRGLDADRFAARVSLQPGFNRLLVKVCGDDSPPMLALRLAQPNGSPDRQIEVDSDPVHAATSDQDAATKTPAAKAKKADARPVMYGPIPDFERLIKSGQADKLDAYARYLVSTQSDDSSEFLAREMSRRAAEAGPTVKRLLLAGSLAENRNQRAIWVERAEALIAKGKASEEDIVATLLERAGHARSGANFRDAIPYYEKVLQRDPGNIPATLAIVELYDEAGLKQTALAFLQRALEQNPRSVALLRATIAALRDQSRTTEAEELTARYGEVRFDDPSVLRGRIELAVARRDPNSATRWIDRLITTNPDSAGTLRTAAETYLSFGDRTRAVAMYRRALELAPDDTDVMKELADVYALGGQTDEQLGLLRRILELKPQAKEIREYVAHAGPAKAKPDEAYARPSVEFLKERGAPAEGRHARTLVDLQVTTVFANGLASRFHQVVFQPLTDAAAAEMRQYAFGYEADSQAVALRGARVYRKNGQMDEAVESGEGAANDPSTSMYTSARTFYVQFPRLNPGDVVELLYRVEDIAHRNAFADYFGEIVYLESRTPIGRAEYVLIAPKSRPLYFNEPRVPGLRKAVTDKGDDRVYQFVAEKVPAVEPEPNQPPATEFFGHIHVSTYRTWDEVGKWYWGLVRDQFVPDDEVRRRARELTKGLTDERAKVNAIYDFVVQKTRYVALEFGIFGFKPYRCAQIFARGFGDCKDKATLIVTMLKEIGIPATIVIVRTGHKGLFETAPASLAPFDHAIAYVPSLNIYLDGTAEYTGSNELPAMDRGAMALQINEGNPKLVHLPDPEAKASITSQRFEATLSPDASASLDWRVDVTGVEAPGWRVRFHAEASRKARVQQLFAHLMSGAEVEQLETNNLEDVEESIKMRVRAKVGQFARKEAETLSIPVGPKEFLVKDLAPTRERHLDVRLPAQWTTEHEWVIHLPAGSRVKSIPPAAEGATPFGKYKVEVENAGNKLRVKTTIALTRTRIAKTEYAAFRQFCESVDRALGQRALVNVNVLSVR